MLDTNKTGTLPTFYDTPRYPAVPMPGATYTMLPEAEPAEAAVPLAHYLWILKRHCWRLLAFIASCVVVTLLVSLRLTPIYEAVTTLDIDRQTPPGIIGQEANRTALNDADQFLATQVKLIQSDTVLRPIVQKFHLRKMEGVKTESGKAAAAEDAPIVLKKLKVTRPPNTYLLLVSYRSSDPKLAADVANGVARSYIETTFNMRFKASARTTQTESVRAA